MVPEETTTAEASEWPSLLSSFTGMLEGRVLNVFGSNDGAAAAPEGSSRPGQDSQQVQEEEEEGQTSRTQEGGEPAVPSATEQAVALETDLPELGRLERSITVDDLLPRHEPAPRSGNHMVVSSKKQARRSKSCVSFHIFSSSRLFLFISKFLQFMRSSCSAVFSHVLPLSRDERTYHSGQGCAPPHVKISASPLCSSHLRARTAVP